MQRLNQKIFVILAVLILWTGTAFGLCEPRFLNPITEVNWGAIFPIKIAGMLNFGSDYDDTTDHYSSPVCVCGGIPGLHVSFWDPFKIIEAVTDAWCIPSMGIKLSGITAAGRLNGTSKTTQSKEDVQTYFAQAHHINFPVWAILDLLTDIPCVADGQWDLSYVTELDPTWQSNIEAMILNPEVMLFANPVLGLSCIADAVSASAGMPRDELYWCQGQWPGVYPQSIGATAADPVVGAIAHAGRLMYKLNREGLVCDNAIDVCGCTWTPIWVKSHYRIQLVRPVTTTGSIIKIGEPSTLWEWGKSPSGFKGGDNWAYIFLHKVNCCITYTPDFAGMAGGG